MEKVFVVLPGRGLLAVAGEDRRAFLQGLVSNDIERVGATQAVRAALLTPQGKYIYDFLLAERGDALLIDGEAARRDDLKRRLAMIKRRSKVTLAPRDEIAMVVA